MRKELQATKKFTHIEYNSKVQQQPTVAKENSITYCVKLEKVKGYEDLISNGSKLGKFYGMTKFHKTAFL